MYATRKTQLRESSPSRFVQTTDIALFGLLCIAPFFLGGRYAIGQFVYAALAALAAIAWTLHRCLERPRPWKRSAGDLLLLMAFLLVGFQLLALPGGLLAKLSPGLSEKLLLWGIGSGQEGGLGAWSKISLVPNATLGALAMLAAFSMLYFVVVQRTRQLSDVIRILAFVGIGAVLLAIVGIVQYVSGTEKFLGFYEHPFRGAGGSATAGFYNNNHFAHMLALGIGPLVGWLAATLIGQRKTSSFNTPSSQTPSRSGRFHNHPWAQLVMSPSVALIALVVVLFAGLMSMSRGGALVVCLAMGVASFVLITRKCLSRKALLALGCSAALVVTAMSIHGFKQVSSGLNTLTSGSAEQLDPAGLRLAVWKANSAALSDFWRIGSGAGTHRHVIPAYLEKSYPLEFTHAESGYLQIATETGTPGIILCVSAILLVAYWCFSAWRHSPDRQHSIAVAAVTAGIAASIVHSIWDFVWYIPASMATTAVLVACAFRLKQLAVSPHSNAEESPSLSLSETNNALSKGNSANMPVQAWAIAAITILASILMLGNRIGPALASSDWDAYLLASTKMMKTDRAAARNLASKPMTVPERITQTDAMIGHLEAVARRTPNDPRVHSRLAGQLLKRFGLAQYDSPNFMPLSQIRDAAIASKFPSSKALHAWLAKATGKSYRYLDQALLHANASAQKSPFSSSGYLYLSELCFLQGKGSMKDDYFTQAQQVNPFDGQVLIRAGTEAWLARDSERAIKLWKEAFNSSAENRNTLISMLAGKVPVMFIIQTFEPNQEVLSQLDLHYQQLGQQKELDNLRSYSVSYLMEKAKKASGEEAGKLWFDAFVVNKKLGQFDQAITCGKTAVQLNQHNMQYRSAVGRLLLQQRQFEEAITQLQWCVTRKPSDQLLQRDLKRAKQGQLHAVQATNPNLPVLPRR